MFEGWENFYLIVGPSACSHLATLFSLIRRFTGFGRLRIRCASHN